MAKRLGLVGWVRNAEDGSVEILAQGEKEKLEELLEWCYHGPPEASVSDLEFVWFEAKGKFRGFVVKR
ncbi:MAG: acylphosphatase [Candidatus Micrarchaeota archaeon]